MANHSCMQSKSDSVQRLWVPKNIFQKYKKCVLFNEFGNKLNKK